MRVELEIEVFTVRPAGAAQEKNDAVCLRAREEGHAFAEVMGMSAWNLRETIWAGNRVTRMEDLPLVSAVAGQDVYDPTTLLTILMTPLGLMTTITRTSHLSVRQRHVGGYLSRARS